jgi:hypothetical protein
VRRGEAKPGARQVPKGRAPGSEAEVPNVTAG